MFEIVKRLEEEIEALKAENAGLKRTIKSFRKHKAKQMKTIRKKAYEIIDQISGLDLRE